jgi:hypothetical protein
MLKAKATNIKVKKAPTNSKEIKSKIAVDCVTPYAKKGIPKPKTKLNESDQETPT